MDGHSPRKDRLMNLVEIAKLFKIQSENYPIFKPKLLSALVKAVLGPTDPRTEKKYFDCIISYCGKDKIHGVYNVTQFCKELGA